MSDPNHPPRPPAAPDPAQAALAQLQRTELLCGTGSFALHWPDQVVAVSPGLQALIDGTASGARLPAVDVADRVDAKQTLDTLAWIPAAERVLVARFWRGATVGEPFEFEHGLLCRDGRRRQVLHRGLLTAATAAGQAPVGHAILQDITDRREAERRIQALAHIDDLTGLATRHHLLQRVDAAVHQAQRRGTGFSLLAIEVPRVRELGLTMGRAAGDALATAMAARLREELGAEPLIGHLGSGEFGLMLRHDEHQADAQVLAQAQALSAALHKPVRFGHGDVYPLCRIGTARWPEDGADAHALLGAAQTARRDAPPGGVARFQSASAAQALRGLQLESALRRALGAGEFSLAYQPQVCLSSGTVLGAEAQLQWHAAEWGLVSSGEFLPVAERTGLIVAIGDWVLRTVCAQIVAWREAGLPALRVAVDISPVQFQLGDVALSIQRALADSGAEPAALALELTEAALQHDADRVIQTLKTLQRLGVSIVLDDFGSGRSGISSLRQLPISLVKVDRGFVQNLTTDPDSASVARSVISLAHGLHIPVLADGVETSGQLGMLVAAGCDRMQGPLFSPALDATAMTALLRSGRTLEAAQRLPHAQRQRTLLLVDDEQSILSALKRLFRRDGYQVLTATSGADGLELLATHPVDVILSDQRMPGMTGVEFLRRTKALHPDTIRMTLSGFTDLQSIIDAVNEGAVYKFLTKPWDDELLRSHVAQAFAQKEMADENRRLQDQVTAAHGEQAALNQRLAQLLERQRAHADLVAVSAGGLHDLLDLLPAAVIGLDTDGQLAYVNERAGRLLPEALARLGAQPGPQVRQLLDSLPCAAQPQALPGLAGDTPGQPVQLAGQDWLGWRRRLPAQGPTERGELLVLAPRQVVQPTVTGAA